MTSLANAVEPSSCAAAALGPKTAIPASRTASATPATRGASGPTMTRSTPSPVARAATAAPSSGSTGCSLASCPIPGFPGAACSAVTCGSRDNARTRACSRAPVPTTRISTLPECIGGPRRTAARSAPDERRWTAGRRSDVLEALLEARPDRRPLRRQDREHHRVAPRAVGPDDVLAQDALAHRTEPCDGGLRTQVDRVRLDLDAVQVAVVECVGEERQLRRRVDDP